MVFLAISCCVITLIGTYHFLKINDVLYDILRKQSDQTRSYKVKVSDENDQKKRYEDSLDHKVTNLEDVRIRRLNRS